ADGRWIVFASYDTQFAPPDLNPNSDVFVYDRLTVVYLRCSVSSTGVAAQKHCYRGSVSGDGNVVVFTSADTTLDPGNSGAFQDIFVRDVAAGTTRRVSVSSSGVAANGESDWPSVSTDGR